jgi:hypothetical protein
MSLDLSDEQIAELVYAFLDQAVPASAIAHALELDPSIVKEAQSLLRTRKYGTDELGEAMNDLMWTALGQAYHEIRFGTSTNKMRFIQMVLGRSVAIAGKQPPEIAEKARAALDTIRSEMTKPAAEGIYAKDETFVVGG